MTMPRTIPLLWKAAAPIGLPAYRQTEAVAPDARRTWDRIERIAGECLRAKVTILLDPAAAATLTERAVARAVISSGTPIFAAEAAEHEALKTESSTVSMRDVAAAGVPIQLADGYGCVCAIGDGERQWKAADRATLGDVAAEVSERLRLAAAADEQRGRADGATRRAELLDTILSVVPDHVFVMERSGRYTWVSRAAAQGIGQSAEQLLGKTLAQLGFPTDITLPVEREIQSVFETGGAVSGEATFPTPQGPRHFEHVLSPVFGPGGKVEAVVATVRDITGRKALEEHLRRGKADAEDAGVAKDRFLAALSHELRTPLTPVLAEVSAIESEPSLPRSLRQSLHMIRRNVELQARLIDDLLDLTRISRGKIALALETVDLHAALRETADMCLAEAYANGVTLFVGELNGPHHVRADGARLRQILWNLIKNAIKFTPAGGEVRIGATHERGRARIEIIDTGIGIALENLSRIFRAFEQGDVSTAHRYGGLGLGLAIAKALVNLHGGALAAHSDGPGRGATFTLTLPTVAAPPPVAHTIDTATPTRAGQSTLLRVLLVDDHPDTLRAIERLLPAERFTVTPASNVAKAIEACAANTFDLLVSDIGLPDGSGLDLMRQLVKRYGLKGIALSGYGMEDDVRRSRQAGFAAHLTKPITSEALLDSIRAVMGK